MKYSARDQATIARWSARLKKEGLGPIDRQCRDPRAKGEPKTQTKVEPIVSPAMSDHFDRCRDFAKVYPFPDASWRRVWSLYSRGTASRAIAAVTGLCRASVRWRIRVVRVAMAMHPHLISVGAKLPAGAEAAQQILETFAAHSGASKLPDVHRKTVVVRLWRSEDAAPRTVKIYQKEQHLTPEEMVEAAKKSSPPTLTLAPTDVATGPAQPAPTPEQQAEIDRRAADQAAFDAVKAGPFTPEALSLAARAQYARRFPMIQESTRATIKNHAAMGADIVELNTGGANNMHKGALEWLKAEGFAVEELEAGKHESKLIVTLYKA